jgi:hypothetical protein
MWKLDCRQAARIRKGLFCGGWWPWLSVMATNVAIAAIAAGLIWFIGLGPFLVVGHKHLILRAIYSTTCLLPPGLAYPFR